MEHDVFISYSSKNTQVAEFILSELEKASVKCWMAPNSLNGGDEYEEIIDNAISACKVFVLVYSEPAVNSRWVNSELTIAFSEYKHIIPFKIDQTVLDGKMKVKLIQSHWINAYPEFSAKVEELVQSVKATLNSIETYSNISVEKEESAKELNFVQRFDFEDAEILFNEGKHAEAINLLLPLALKGNRPSQELLCRIYYHLSQSSADGDVIRSISPKVKDSIEAVAVAGMDWANFVMHCYAYKQNDNQASLQYLKAAISSESIGLAFLRLGIVYGFGLGVDVNWKHTEECYKEAETLGCTEAYSYLGQLFRWGYDELQPDIPKSIEYYKKGVAAKDWRAIKSLKDLYLSDVRWFDDAAALLDELAERDTEGIELLYGDYYMMKYYMQDNVESDLKQAVEFLEIALNNGYYEACGTLAAIYYEDEKDKSRKYAETGYHHGDSFSYAVLGMIESNEGNYSRAWEIAEERYYCFGQGAGELGELYLEYGFLPSEDYLPTLVKILQNGAAAVGSIEACKCLITLYSEEKYGMKDYEMEEKYRRMSANMGEAGEGSSGVDAILDYAKFLMDKESSHYNPMNALKYLRKAVDKKSLEASDLLLKQFEGKYNSSFYKKQYDKARSYILKSGAFDVGGKMYYKLQCTPVNENNAPSLKEFYLQAFDRFSEENDNKLLIRSLESGAHLLKGTFVGHWELTEEQSAHMKTLLMSNMDKYPCLGSLLKDFKKHLFSESDEKAGKEDFIKGVDSLNARLFYAFNYSFDSDSLLEEQDRILSLLLEPVSKDQCYDEIIERGDPGLVGEKDGLWASALHDLDDDYRGICMTFDVEPIVDLRRCDFKDIVPYFPLEKAVDHYKRLIRAALHLSQNLGDHLIPVSLLAKDGELLDHAEKLLDQNLQLFLIKFVETRIELESLLIVGNGLVNAVYMEDYAPLSEFVKKYIGRLDAAGVRHGLNVPGEEELIHMLKQPADQDYDESFYLI